MISHQQAMKLHASVNPALLVLCASHALQDFMEDLKQLAISANLVIALIISTSMTHKHVIQSLAIA